MNELNLMKNKDTSIPRKEIEHSICHDLIQHRKEKVSCACAMDRHTRTTRSTMDESPSRWLWIHSKVVSYTVWRCAIGVHSGQAMQNLSLPFPCCSAAVRGVAQLRIRERVCQHSRYRSRNYAFVERRFLRAASSPSDFPLRNGELKREKPNDPLFPLNLRTNLFSFFFSFFSMRDFIREFLVTIETCNFHFPVIRKNRKEEKEKERRNQFEINQNRITFSNAS